MRAITRALAVGGVVWLAACTSTPAIPAEDFPAEVERSVCEQRIRCGEFPDVETCKKVRGPLTKVQQRLVAFQAGRLDYDPDRAIECIELTREANPDCTIFGTPPELWTRLNRICGDVFTGDVEPGGTCYVHAECEGVADCQSGGDCGDACCPGQCVPELARRHAAIGEDCRDRPCTPDAYCDASTVCVERHAVGEACDQVDICVEGARCADHLSPGGGTCIVPPDEGEPCEWRTMFPEVACLRKDNWCSHEREICEPLVEIGGHCSTTLECVAWGHCDESGTCVERPARGEPCQPDGAPCLGNFVGCAEDGTCRGSEPPAICTELAPAG